MAFHKRLRTLFPSQWTKTLTTAKQTTTTSPSPICRSMKNGKEITYYATENVSADAKSLDYTDVVLTKPDGFQGDNAFVEIPQVSSDEPSGENVAENDESKTGSDWAVIENGTFTNALKGTATIEGIKLWQNVPGDFPLEELPWITIYVQQKAPDDSWDDKDLSVVSIPAGADGSDYAQIGNTGKYVEGAIAWATLTPSKDNPTNEWQYSITKKGCLRAKGIRGRAADRNQTGADVCSRRSVRAAVQANEAACRVHGRGPCRCCLPWRSRRSTVRTVS